MSPRRSPGAPEVTQGIRHTSGLSPQTTAIAGSPPYRCVIAAGEFREKARNGRLMPHGNLHPRQPLGLEELTSAEIIKSLRE
jgi:hypothetical protein